MPVWRELAHENTECREGELGRKQQIRCAIYTRKSTEDGLEQEFNSLDAQREAGEALIASQKHEGWVTLPDHYDDGGFSGGNAERPGLHRLLNDIKSSVIDCVVVYKVDRLSRSLLDFARIMGTFEERNVSFVSVTQQFNTSHSMGRLTERPVREDQDHVWNDAVVLSRAETARPP